MRFSDFLRTTVLISAAAASALVVVTVAGASSGGDDLVVPVSAGWWVLAGAIGIWVGLGLAVLIEGVCFISLRR